LNPLPPRLVAHLARLRSMAEKHTSLQRDPLSNIFTPVSNQPFLLIFPLHNLDFHRFVGDRNENMLLLW
jgi:hypothetical protein